MTKFYIIDTWMNTMLVINAIIKLCYGAKRSGLCEKMYSFLSKTGNVSQLTYDLRALNLGIDDTNDFKFLMPTK